MDDLKASPLPEGAMEAGYQWNSALTPFLCPYSLAIKMAGKSLSRNSSDFGYYGTSAIISKVFGQARDWKTVC